MALNKTGLKAGLKTAFQNAPGTNDNFSDLAQEFADAVDTYYKTGSVSGFLSGGSNLSVSTPSFTALKAGLKTAFQNAPGTNDAFDTIAQEISDAIDTHTKTGTVSATTGPGSGAISVPSNATLKTDVQTAFQNAPGTADNFDTIAGDIALAVDTYLKTGFVVGTSGGVPLPVT